MIRVYAKKIPALGEQNAKIDMSRKSPSSLLLIRQEVGRNNAAFQEQMPNKHFKTIRERGNRISKGDCHAIQRKGSFINNVTENILNLAYNFDSTLRGSIELYLTIDNDDRNFNEQLIMLRKIKDKVGLALVKNTHCSLVVLQKAVASEIDYVTQQLADPPAPGRERAGDENHHGTRNARNNLDEIADQLAQHNEIAGDEGEDDIAEFADELSPHSNEINIQHSDYNARSSAHQPARLLEEEKHHMTSRHSNSIILPYSGYPGRILTRPLARLQPAELAARLPEEEKGHAVPQETEMRPEYLDTLVCGAYLESISVLPEVSDYINANHHLREYLNLYLIENNWKFKEMLLNMIIAKAEQDTNNPCAVHLAKVAKQEHAEYFS